MSDTPSIRTLDKSLLLAVLFFLGLGLVQVYSSSFIFAIEEYADGLYFFKRQLGFVFLGVAIMVGFAYMPSRWLQRWGIWVWVLAVLGLAATLVPGLSVKAGGASRWVAMPFGQRFEPAELLKIGFPLLMATFIANSKRQMNLAYILVRGLIVVFPLLILLRQPDFGTLVICTLVILTMLFAFGLQWRYIFASIAVILPTFYFLVINVPYRYARIKVFFDPWSDPGQKGFQIIQSMLSFHAGGLTGVGLGQGQGKLFFLPEAHTDFALAVLGEEMGFLGLAFVLLLYGFVVFRGLQISLRCENVFFRALGLGVTLVLAISVFVNVGVVLGFLPTKGLTLPFMSYGGSSIISTCIGIGLLLNIDRFNRAYGAPFVGYQI